MLKRCSFFIRPVAGIPMLREAIWTLAALNPSQCRERQSTASECKLLAFYLAWSLWYVQVTYRMFVPKNINVCGIASWFVKGEKAEA